MKEKELHTQIPSWRFYTGLLCFLIAFISPFCPLFLEGMDLTAKQKIVLGTVLLIGIPDLFFFVGVVLMGKQGYESIKRYLLKFYRTYVMNEEVSRVRYYLGISMMIIPIVYGWIVVYIPETWIPTITQNKIPISIVLDALFFSSFFVAGGDFWNKVRSLFVYNMKAS